jgi:uncharacterized protein
MSGKRQAMQSWRITSGPMLVWLSASLMVAIAAKSSCWAQLPAADSKQLYYGELDAGQRVFRFLVTTRLNLKGEREAELQSLDEGGAKFSLTRVVMDANAFEFELAQTKAVYKATAVTNLNDDHAKRSYRGTWNQSGVSLDLTMQPMDAPPQDSPSEVWIGDLNAGLQTLTMQFRIYQAADKPARVFVDSVSQKVGGFKGTRKITDDTVEFEVPALRGKFTGKQSDESSITGKWSQGIPLDLILKKADRPLTLQSSPPKRPQTPQPPFPYESATVVIMTQTDGVQLEGTLSIPNSSDTARRFPAAVLVSGSGPQDRDETLLGHKPFWVLADHLARQGIAVLRYDDRGVGGSTGDFGQATSREFANDANSVVQYLRQHPRINPQQIGIIGHSEGGIVAPMVAAENPAVAWIVLMAGTGVNGEQILYSQGKLIIEAEGGNQEQVSRQRLLQEVCFEAVQSIKPGEDPATLVESAVATILERAKQLEAAEPKANSTESASELEQEKLIKEIIKQQVTASLQAMNTPWLRYFAQHEPGPVLEKVGCPVLAINGQYDVQVDPKLNLPKIEASLAAGGNRNIKVVELPGLNHLFQTCENGGVSNYEKIEETIAPAALKTVSDWILEQTR